MNIKIPTFEKLKYIQQIQTSSPTQRKKIKILISLESENYRNNTIEGIKKYRKSLHKSKNPSIFAPRLRENVSRNNKFGSLGEWLKPAVC